MASQQRLFRDILFIVGVRFIKPGKDSIAVTVAALMPNWMAERSRGSKMYESDE